MDYPISDDPNCPIMMDEMLMPDQAVERAIGSPNILLTN